MAGHSKLILPASVLQIRRKFETIGRYFTLEEVTGERSTIGQLIQLLQTLKRSDVVRWISALMEAVGRKESRQAQLMLVNDLMEPALAAAIAKKDDGSGEWVVFHRRQLWLLLQLAIISCREDVTTEESANWRYSLGKASLMASDFLKEIELVRQPIPKGEELRWLITLFVSLTELNNKHELFVRGQAFWFDSLSDPEIKAKFEKLGVGPDFNAPFERMYGISFDEFYFVATLLYFMFLSSASQSPIRPGLYDATLSSNYFSDEAQAKVLSILSVNADKMAAYLFGEPRQSWATDLSPLLSHPVIELTPGKYACPDLSFFRLYFVDGIYWLLNDAIASNDWRGLFGDIYDHYVSRVIGSFNADSPFLAKTFHRSPKFEGTQDEVCDGLLHWNRTAAFCEYKGTRLNTRQRSGVEVDETIKAIEGHVGSDKGIGQLAKSIGRVLSGKPVVGSGQILDLSVCDLLVPVLVWYEESAGSHVVRIHLQERFSARLEELRIDTQRIGPLVLFTTFDVEVFGQYAQRFSAEAVMRDYCDYLAKYPKDPESAFHSYAARKYPSEDPPAGWIVEQIDEVLEAVMRKAESRGRVDAAGP